MTEEKKKHLQEVARKVKAQDDKIIEAVFIEAARVFGKDVLFIHDCIKQIMQEHFINYKDSNMQMAFIRLAIGIKKLQYPSKISADKLCRTCGEPLRTGAYSNCDDCIQNYTEE